MEIPAFVYWIVIGGVVLAIIASILSYKFIRPKPDEKKRKILIILGILIILLVFAEIIFDHIL